jgi:hypothetical protein
MSKMTSIKMVQLLRCSLLFFFLLLYLPAWLAAEQITLELSIRTGSEAVTFPLQHPTIQKGTVTAVPSALSLQINPSGAEGLLGLNPSSPHYLIVTGPAGHALQGERMELDEAASRGAGNGQWVLESSTLNTSPSVDARWLGAECEVVPHWTLQDNLAEIIRRRLSSPQPMGVPTVWLPRGNGKPQKLIPRLTVASPPRLAWIHDRNKIWPSENTIVAPGQAFIVKSAHPAGFGFSLGGDRRLLPCKVPLTAGPNLLGYPFSEDLRLGVDWGRPADGLAASVSPDLCDRLQLFCGDNPIQYGLHDSGRWIRILGSGSSPGRWDFSSPPLEAIPVGYGFVLIKTKPDPSHIFRPPQR